VPAVWHDRPAGFAATTGSAARSAKSTPAQRLRIAPRIRSDRNDVIFICTFADTRFHDQTFNIPVREQFDEVYTDGLAADPARDR
jgi:hypothetical protein